MRYVVIPGSFYDKESLIRAKSAVDKFGKNSKYLLCGGAIPGRESVAEYIAKFMIDFLNVPEVNITLEEESGKTWQNASNAVKILKKDKNLEEIVLVTTGAHCPRSLMLFKSYFPDVTLSYSSAFENSERSLIQSGKYALREYLGFFKDLPRIGFNFLSYLSERKKERVEHFEDVKFRNKITLYSLKEKMKRWDNYCAEQEEKLKLRFEIYRIKRKKSRK